MRQTEHLDVSRAKPRHRVTLAGLVFAEVLALAALVAPGAVLVGCRPEDPVPEDLVLTAAVVETPDGAPTHFPAHVLGGGEVVVGPGQFTLRLSFDRTPAQAVPVTGYPSRSMGSGWLAPRADREGRAPGR